jgi:hypothetical protein
MESISNVVNETVRVHASVFCFFFFSPHSWSEPNPVYCRSRFTRLDFVRSESTLSYARTQSSSLVQLRRFPVKNWRVEACLQHSFIVRILFYFFVLLIYRLLFWACSCRHRRGFRFGNGAWLSASSLDFSGSIRRAVASGPKSKI